MASDPNTTTTEASYQKCRDCEQPTRCNRESRCCDTLLSDEYWTYCIAERDRVRST